MRKRRKGKKRGMQEEKGAGVIKNSVMDQGFGKEREGKKGGSKKHKE